MKIDKRPLVELKNGKLIFRQKPLSLEKSSETMQGTWIRIEACYLNLFHGVPQRLFDSVRCLKPG